MTTKQVNRDQNQEFKTARTTEQVNEDTRVAIANKRHHAEPTSQLPSKHKSYPKVDQFLSKIQGNESICTSAKSIKRMNEQRATEPWRGSRRKGKQSLSA